MVRDSEDVEALRVCCWLLLYEGEAAEADMRALSAARRDAGGEAMALVGRYDSDRLVAGRAREQRREQAARGSNVREEFIVGTDRAMTVYAGSEKVFGAVKPAQSRGTEELSPA